MVVLVFQEAVDGAKEVAEADRARHFDAIEAQLKQLAEDTAQASVFLPRYDQRHSQEVLAKLTDTLKAQRNLLMPKKAFRFASKAKLSSSTSAATATAPATTTTAATTTAAPAPGVQQPSAALAKLRDNADQTCMLSGLRGGRYVRRDVKGKDLLIEDCDDIELHVPVTLQALFIRRANRCRLYLGPVEGAAHIDDVDDSIIHVGCHQVPIAAASRVCVLVQQGKRVEERRKTTAGLTGVRWLFTDCRCAFTGHIASRCTCTCSRSRCSRTAMSCTWRRTTITTRRRRPILRYAPCWRVTRELDRSRRVGFGNGNRRHG